MLGRPCRSGSATWVFAGRFDLKPKDSARRSGGWVAAAALEQLQKADPTIEAFDFRGHDLRRTAATRMADAGIPNTDIAKVLNHVEGGPRATQVYNRYQYDREKKIALDTWGRVLTAILEDQPQQAQVVPFARA
jgi:integrase